MSTLNLDLQICHSLYSATNALVRAYRPLLEPLDLTYPQYIVMMSLWQKDKVNVKALVEHTRLDGGTLTPILKRLETKGWLKRVVSSDDERQKRIELTAAGRRLGKKAQSIPETMACNLLGEGAKGAELKALCEELYQAIGRLEQK